MEQTSGRNWEAVLLAGSSALVILIFVVGGGIALAGGIADWRETHDTTLSLLPAFLTIAALLLATALIGRAGWLALLQIKNKPAEPAHMPSFTAWAGIVFFIGWIFSILLAVFLIQKPILQWFSLPFYLLAIGMPVYGLIRLGLGELEPGSKLRAWGTLSMGMTLAPFLAMLAEGMALIILLIFIGVFIGFDPQRWEGLRTLAEQLQNIGSQEEAIALLAPFLTNPLVLMGGLFFLSIVTPLAEEAAKSLPVWMAWRKLESPGQGFALGALSGAGFGLMEGLLISTAPGTTWGATLAVRAASSAMHIITSGLVGWGIGKAAQKKRALPALGRYLLGVSVHGIWNACVLVMVYASGLTILSGTTPNIAAMLIATSALCFLSLLILAAPIILWAINHQFQKSLPLPPNPEKIEPPPTRNMVI